MSRTQQYVQEKLGWIFREQPLADFGIDAHVEVVDGEDVSGRLLALQIKSGASWFSEATAGGWWFRPDPSHVTYWLNHSLPVIVVLYDPDSKQCFWEQVTEATLEETAKGGWRVLVPATQRVDETAGPVWHEATKGDPYELRLRELRLAKPWMLQLAAGARLVLEFDEWINKSSGRGSIAIGVDHEDGEDPEILARWEFLIGPSNYAATVPQLFAWADVSLHEETYEDADHDQWATECAIWGAPGFYSESFEEWRARIPDGIRPYQNASGEVDCFRLELALNELGQAFLVVDEFATTGKQQLTD